MFPSPVSRSHLFTFAPSSPPPGGHSEPEKKDLCLGRAPRDERNSSVCSLPHRHIWTPPFWQAKDFSDERGGCSHLSGFVMEPHVFRALMVVARQLLNIPTACLCGEEWMVEGGTSFIGQPEV